MLQLIAFAQAPAICPGLAPSENHEEMAFWEGMPVGRSPENWWQGTSFKRTVKKSCNLQLILLVTRKWENMALCSQIEYFWVDFLILVHVFFILSIFWRVKWFYACVAPTAMHKIASDLLLAVRLDSSFTLPHALSLTDASNNYEFCSSGPSYT